MIPDPDRLGLGLIRQPKTVIFGPGQRRQLAPLARAVARHALVVTDARMATTPEFTAMMGDLREAGTAVSVYDKALPDLPRSNILEAVALFGEAKAGGVPVEAVIGIGGGSCLDLAKMVSVVLANRGEVRDYYGEFKVPGPGLPVLAVPTTGGTGAEVTCVAVIYDDETRTKVGCTSPHLEPVAAIIDPELTVTCPPGLTAATAADALSHLVEGYTARYKNPPPEDVAGKIYTGKNRITDIFAEKGLALVNHALERVIADPSDVAARGDMMFAAYCAGSVIGTTGTAAAHAIQASMAAFSHAPHGFGVSAVLPYVMRFNLPARIPEFAAMGRILGVAAPGEPELDQARKAVLRIEALLEAAGAPLDLKAVGIGPEHFDAIAAGAMKATRLTVNNPREMTEAAVRGMLARGHAADRSWWETP